MLKASHFSPVCLWQWRLSVIWPHKPHLWASYFIYYFLPSFPLSVVFLLAKVSMADNWALFPSHLFLLILFTKRSLPCQTNAPDSCSFCSCWYLNTQRLRSLKMGCEVCEIICSRPEGYFPEVESTHNSQLGGSGKWKELMKIIPYISAKWHPGGWFFKQHWAIVEGHIE